MPERLDFSRRIAVASKSAPVFLLLFVMIFILILLTTAANLPASNPRPRPQVATCLPSRWHFRLMGTPFTSYARQATNYALWIFDPAGS